MSGPEEQFARQILDLAAYTGWRVFRVENSTRVITRRSGARVRVRNVNPQGVGFPDLVLVHPRRHRLIFAELKSDVGRVSDEQHGWLTALGEAGQAAVVWRPRDWTEIERMLTGEGSVAA